MYKAKINSSNSLFYTTKECFELGGYTCVQLNTIPVNKDSNGNKLTLFFSMTFETFEMHFITRVHDISFSF